MTLLRSPRVATGRVATTSALLDGLRAQENNANRGAAPSRVRRPRTRGPTRHSTALSASKHAATLIVSPAAEACQCLAQERRLLLAHLIQQVGQGQAGVAAGIQRVTHQPRAVLLPCQRRPVGERLFPVVRAPAPLRCRLSIVDITVV